MINYPLKRLLLLYGWARLLTDADIWSMFNVLLINIINNIGGIVVTTSV